MKASDHRARARKMLGEKIFGNTWLLALVVCLIVTAILGALSFTLVGTLIVVGAFEVALAGIFLRLARKQEEVKIERVFNGFSENFPRNLLLGLLKEIFIALWTLLFIVPGIVKYCAYSMSSFIAYDHPDYDWKKCLDESQRMMKGHKMEYFLLNLSFIGWMIVGALCLGVGLLWVKPYITAAQTSFYQNLVGEATQEN
ncbi:MAG: DUF975 family protein [Eubacteriales bacterium]